MPARGFGGSILNCRPTARSDRVTDPLRSLGSTVRVVGAITISVASLCSAAATDVNLEPDRLGLPQSDATALQSAIAAGEWARAESVLYGASAADPRSSELHRALGIAHYQAGRVFLAARELKRSDAIATLDSPTRFLLASAYIKLGRSHWARPELERLIEARPQEPRYRYTRARVHYDQQRFQLGLEDIREAIRLNPESAEAHDLLGQCLEGLGDFDGAIAAYERAIALHDSAGTASPWPGYHLGSLRHDLGDLEGAEGALRSAVAADPEHAVAYAELGLVLHKASRLAEAAHALETAARLSPADENVQYALVGIYRELGQTERAAKSLERFRRIRNRHR